MELNQITLPVNDMAKAVDFYRLLGCQLIVDTPHYARFAAPDGDSSFSLSLEEETFSNGAIMYFEHEQLDTLYAELCQRGLTFDQPPTEQRYLWKEAVLHDPSGNKIKLYWAGKNRLNPPWRVSAQG